VTHRILGCARSRRLAVAAGAAADDERRRIGDVVRCRLVVGLFRRRRRCRTRFRLFRRLLVFLEDGLRGRVDLLVMVDGRLFGGRERMFRFFHHRSRRRDHYLSYAEAEIVRFCCGSWAPLVILHRKKTFTLRKDDKSRRFLPRRRLRRLVRRSLHETLRKIE
jgi:hypothetical protein